jgi:hypothetical protein
VTGEVRANAPLVLTRVLAKKLQGWILGYDSCYVYQEMRAVKKR